MFDDQDLLPEYVDLLHLLNEELTPAYEKNFYDPTCHLVHGSEIPEKDYLKIAEQHKGGISEYDVAQLFNSKLTEEIKRLADNPEGKNVEPCYYTKPEQNYLSYEGWSKSAFRYKTAHTLIEGDMDYFLLMIFGYSPKSIKGLLDRRFIVPLAFSLQSYGDTSTDMQRLRKKFTIGRGYR